MGEIKSYRDLDVWQLGVELAVDCYSLTSRFPADERFGLTGQTRKAAVSIPSNVAEGHNRRSPQSNNAYRNHVSIALGSSGELDTQFEIALRLGYLKTAELEPTNDKLDGVGQMLRRLQQSLERESRLKR